MTGNGSVGAMRQGLISAIAFVVAVTLTLVVSETIPDGALQSTLLFMGALISLIIGVVMIGYQQRKGYAAAGVVVGIVIGQWRLCEFVLVMIIWKIGGLAE